MMYYWDPARNGCDHKLGTHFQIVKPQLKSKTPQTSVSYPEYNKMIRNKKVTLTFGFGYVDDPADPLPFSDADYGMTEFRSFLGMVRNDLRLYHFRETEILESEYLGGCRPERRIGSRFEFEKQGLNFEVKVVASGSVHAKNFLRTAPSDRAGCNSYSYYTKPFFDFKANLIPQDVSGTKGLDIISNVLPSYFSLNADNAAVLLKAIVNRIEQQSNASGISVLVNVLGDEDNP